jgi:hypothetical protein
MFGQFKLACFSEFIHGRDATRDELASGGPVANAVAQAIVFLARHGLLYIDIREPNVRVKIDDSGRFQRAVLVDYDDVITCPPITDYRAIEGAVRDHDHALTHYRLFDGLMTAISVAFHGLEKQENRLADGTIGWMHHGADESPAPDTLPLCHDSPSSARRCAAASSRKRNLHATNSVTSSVTS